MCLILFGVRPAPGIHLVVAANRDEFYDRPASRAAWWEDHPGILAGRDLRMGGTWLGVTSGGRFAAVTNFRETRTEPDPPLSRGELTTGFLSTDRPPLDYLREIDARRNDYRGFNLVLDDGRDFFYYSNRTDGIRKLEPGCYGLSNQLLDCDWPKVTAGRSRLASLIDTSAPREKMFTGLFELLEDHGNPEPFSDSFIATQDYGTCASTAVWIGTDHSVEFQERGFRANGEKEGMVTYSFTRTR